MEETYYKIDKDELAELLSAYHKLQALENYYDCIANDEEYESQRRACTEYMASYSKTEHEVFSTFDEIGKYELRNYDKVS